VLNKWILPYCEKINVTIFHFVDVSLYSVSIISAKLDKNTLEFAKLTYILRQRFLEHKTVELYVNCSTVLGCMKC
jgi:hypothetical protein